MVGSTLAHYRITAALGAGGMGEVWRAEDTKLGREVALKVLPAEFASDEERLARFEREAKVLASLNHPNIAHLYGLETAVPAVPRSDDEPSGTPGGSEPRAGTLPGPQAPASPGPVTFLVMELVDGEGLDEIIARGPIPVEEAIPAARQIADALEAAHEAGIVHRDLKPANVRIRPGGTVKVLDFGLAKVWEPDRDSASLSLSPTLTRHATAAGVILGTAAYMSPEQARGTRVDRRADIWAFGVVLWEMLTGRSLFQGDTLSDVLASVLKEAPDLEALPADLPTALRRLLERCLEKDPKRRLQAMGEARIVLEDPDAIEPPCGGPAASDAAGTTRRRRPAAAWVVAAVAGVVAAALLAALVRREPEPVLRASIPPPAGTSFSLPAVAPGPAVVSPDGRRLAFTARDDSGAVRLYVRDLDASEAHVLSGTDGAQYPFWSPDSRWLAFFTQSDAALKKVDAAGGPPITLCPATNGKGGAWSPDGVIVFTPDASTPLYRVSAAGGEAQQVTEIDAARHNSHRHPRFLPDGRRFLYLARSVSPGEGSVVVGSLDGGEPRELMKNPTQVEIAGDHLFFLREQTLMMQPFDVDEVRLEGEPVPVTESVMAIPAAALGIFSASPGGVLAYHTGTIGQEVEARWIGRSGAELAVLDDAAEYQTVALSPDDTTAAFTVVARPAGTFDLWLYELERGVRTRFTFDDGMELFPVWAPDGETLYFASDRNGSLDIYRIGVGGNREAELVHAGDRDLSPSGISPDGAWLVCTEQARETSADVWAVPLTGGGDPVPLRRTEAIEVAGPISPDGRWMAYFSDESGTFEVYVTPFPEGGRRWQVSGDGGLYPHWRSDGREIVYLRGDGQLEATALELGDGSVRLGAVTELFSVTPPDNLGPTFSPTSDTERFLVVPSPLNPASTLLHVVVGWPRLLEAR